MQPSHITIDVATLERLVGAKGALRESLRAAQIQGTRDGWTVGLDVAGQIQMVGRVRDGLPRKWRSLDSCFAFVRDRLAITTFTVDGQHFVAETPRKRIDASQRLKALHRALKTRETA